MYRVRNPSYRKRDQVMRWALPDRIFFACGACHILAHAFLERYPSPEYKPVWIKPDEGYSGNHVFIFGNGWVFDYHGYSEPDKFIEHTWKRARQWWPGWAATLVELRPLALVSEAVSLTYEGLHHMEPGQFLYDAMPRARTYVSRFPAPDDFEARRRSVELERPAWMPPAVSGAGIR